MSERTLKRLVGALAVAVALWVVTSLVAGGGGGAAGPAGEITTIFEGVSESTLEAVRLSGTDRPVELRRDGEAWTVNGYASDSATVARFLDLIYDVEVGNLAATNPANHDRMGVSQDSAESIELEVDGETRRVLIGKQGPRFATVYGRIPGEDEVYVLEGDLRMHVIRLFDDWRNKRMVSVDTTRVHRIEVERDGEAFTVLRGDSVWTLEGGGEVDAQPVRNILMELASLRASSILEEGDSLAALPEGGSTVAYDESGTVLAEVRIGSGEADRWGRVPSDSTVYRLPSFRIDRIAPERSEVVGEDGGS